MEISEGAKGVLEACSREILRLADLDEAPIDQVRDLFMVTYAAAAAAQILIEQRFAMFSPEVRVVMLRDLERQANPMFDSLFRQVVGVQASAEETLSS